MIFDQFCQTQVFVINLKSRIDKWNTVKPRIEEAGFFNIQQVNAVDGACIDLNNSFYPISNKDPEFKNNPGKVGCLLSHVQIWNDIVNLNLPQAIVFEDDVYFPQCWHSLVRQYVENTPQDFDVVYLGSQITNDYSKEIIQVPVCTTHAMLVSNYGARKLLQLISKEIYTLDNLLFDLMKENALTYYVWNAKKHNVENVHNQKHWRLRNSGLVYQDFTIKSDIDSTGQDYSFSNAWFEFQKPVHEKFLKSNMKILEIGAHEGRSTIFFLQSTVNMVYSIDPYDDSDLTSPVDKNTFTTFKANIQLTGQSHRHQLYKNYSHQILPELLLKQKTYDYILIDGSHIPHHILLDAVFCFHLLNPGGYLFFDDYLGGNKDDVANSKPKFGIDKFLDLYKDQLVIVYQQYHLVVMKTDKTLKKQRQYYF
eukprot:Pgem_evm12s12025